MPKKRFAAIGLIVFLSIIFVLLVCGILKHRTKITDLNKYGDFSKYDLLGNLEIFPQAIPDGYIDCQYYLEYEEGVLDSECQIYLRCSYDVSTYQKETNRLAQIEECYKDKRQKIHYDTDYFAYPAYVTVFENDGCYEYALLDEDNVSIIYIFLQWTKEKDIKFPHLYLPKDYDCVVSTEQSFSIYNFWDSKNEWYYVVPRVNKLN